MKLTHAFIQTFASQLGQSIASVLTGIIIARGLGPSGQGDYATFRAGVMLGTVFLSLGQFHGNVLGVAAGQAGARLLVWRGLFHATVVAAIGLGTARIWAGMLSSDAVLISLFAVVLSLEVIAQMVRGINLGQHRVTAWNVATLVQRLVYLSIMLLLVLTAALKLKWVVGGWAVAAFFSVIASIIWIWHASPPEPISLAQLVSGWGERLGRGVRPYITILVTMLLVRADIWMLRPMIGPEAVGQMSVAIYLGEWMWYVPSILGNLLFAVVAANQGSRSAEQVARSARVIALALVVLMGILLIVGRDLVGLLYGPSYEQAGLLFLLLVPGMTALGIHLVVDSYFAGIGFPPLVIWTVLLAVFIKVGLNLIAVPAFDAAGAAVITSVVYCFMLTVKVVAFHRRTGIGPSDLLVLNGSDVSWLRSRIPLIS